MLKIIMLGFVLMTQISFFMSYTLNLFQTLNQSLYEFNLVHLSLTDVVNILNKPNFGQ